MNITPVDSRAQEAMETAAQTRAEAAQGDVQAKIKLVQLAKLSGIRPPAAAAPASAATPVTPETADTSAQPNSPPPPSGVVLNVKQ